MKYGRKIKDKIEVEREQPEQPELTNLIKMKALKSLFRPRRAASTFREKDVPPGVIFEADKEEAEMWIKKGAAEKAKRGANVTPFNGYDKFRKIRTLKNEEERKRRIELGENWEKQVWTKAGLWTDKSREYPEEIK